MRNVFDMDWTGLEGLDVASTMVLGQDSEEEIDARFYLLYLKSFRNLYFTISTMRIELRFNV